MTSVFTPGLETAIRRLAVICPFGSVAESLQGRLTPLLTAARIFISPALYSRFSLSLLLYPAIGEALALLLLPAVPLVLVLSSLAMVQVLPILVPLVLAGSRRKGTDAELPFFLIALSIISQDSSPSIDDGLRRVAALGDAVFPALTYESAVIERDLTFTPGSPGDVLEKTIHGNPSRSLREFVHSFTTTLTTGKSVAEFVDEEAQSEVGKMESEWRAFSESVGSLAEVSLMVLALFPVGVEMIAAAIPGLASSLMLVASMGLLAAFSAVLLVVLEAVQPATHNAVPSASYVLVTLASWALSTFLYYEGVIPIAFSLMVPLAVSLFGFLRTRGCYDRVRRGEQEVALLLHDLAEESKAGVSLPEALSKAASQGETFLSIGEPLSSFHRSIMLGSTPAEAQKSITHPSWLVRLSFGLLSIAFATGAGFEQLERLSRFFKRIADARRNASRSLLPFVMVGVAVPVISVASMNFLGSFGSGGGIPFLPSFSSVSQSYVLISISAVAMLTGLLLSKLLTQTSRHGVAIPLLLLSTLASLLVFGLI